MVAVDVVEHFQPYARRAAAAASVVRADAFAGNQPGTLGRRQRMRHLDPVGLHATTPHLSLPDRLTSTPPGTDQLLSDLPLICAKHDSQLDVVARTSAKPFASQIA